MRVKGYDIDYLFCESIGYKLVSDALCDMTVKEFKAKKYQFIEDNNILVLKYKGDEQWGDEIYDNLMVLNDLLDNNKIRRLLEIELPDILIKRLKEMNVITKQDGLYKWTGSKNYQAITKNLLKYYESK